MLQQGGAVCIQSPHSITYYIGGSACVLCDWGASSRGSSMPRSKYNMFGGVALSASVPACGKGVSIGYIT